MSTNCLKMLSKLAVSRVIPSRLTSSRAKTIRDAQHRSTDEFDRNYASCLDDPNIDGWWCRKYMNDLCGMDLVPDPIIINAGLRACRRLNDYALAVRWLEACKEKCGSKRDEIYPYILQEIRPTLNELGVLTPEEMGYSHPELAQKDFFESF